MSSNSNAGQEQERQIAFLFYANRSGSTFFSSLLDGIESLGMSIEGAFFAKLIWSHAEIRTDEDVEKLMNGILADPRVEGWESDREKIRGFLNALPRPADTQAIIKSFLLHFFSEQNPDYIVVKGAGLNPFIPQLRDMFKNPKFIHIVRDPRAIYNSQTKTESSYTGIPMANDPVICTKRWLRIVQDLRALLQDDYMEVRYEDLMEDTPGTMQRVCSYLQTPGLKELSFDGQGSTSSYFEKIPEKEKTIHGNVKGGKAVTDRIMAWRKEVDDVDIHLIQKTARLEMNRLGYVPVELEARNVTGFKVARRVAGTRIVAIVEALRRYVAYLRNPYILNDQIISKYMQIKGSFRNR